MLTFLASIPTDAVVVTHDLVQVTSTSQMLDIWLTTWWPNKSSFGTRSERMCFSFVSGEQLKMNIILLFPGSWPPPGPAAGSDGRAADPFPTALLKFCLNLSPSGRLLGPYSAHYCFDFLDTHNRLIVVRLFGGLQALGEDVCETRNKLKKTMRPPK